MKKGFINIMEELGDTETERLELLCEKVGPESSRKARTIRACNADSPGIAIKKIWERLERRFGAAEQIENYILKKIKEFRDFVGSLSSALRPGRPSIRDCIIKGTTSV